MRALASLLLLLSALGCRASLPEELGTSAAAPAPARPVAEAQRAPEPGQPTPGFELLDTEGRRWSSSALRGRAVVLSWYDEDCPFLEFAYRRAGLAERVRRAEASGAVWLAVDSGARRATLGEVFAPALPHPLLVDVRGRVARRYGVRVVGETLVIAPDGTLAYRGPLDDAPFGVVAGGGTRRDYVAETLAALASGSTPPVPAIEPYGAHIRYADR